MAQIDKKNFFKELNSRLKLEEQNYDWVLLGTIVLLNLLGLAFLASSLAVESQDVFISEFVKQFIFGTWIGGVACFIMAKIDYHFLFKHRNLLLIATFFMLAYIAIPVTLAGILNIPKLEFLRPLDILQISPYYANEAVRWLSFRNSINFQPVEFAKLSLAVYFAYTVNKAAQDKKEIDFEVLKRPLLAFILTALMVIVQPDLGSTILLTTILFAVMWVGKVPIKILFTGFMILVLVFSFLAISSAYRRERVEAFLNSSVESYQVDQAVKAVSEGGLFGKGYGNGEVKYYIPEVSNDAIIAVVAEEMGFVFTMFLISLYLVILFRGLKIAKEAPDIGGSALAAGVAVWIVSQAFLNITSMTGLTPAKGIPLPLISEGGTSMVVVLGALGVLLNISSQSTNKKPFFKSKIIS